MSSLVPLEVFPSLEVLCYCFDKHGNLYAITDNSPTLHIVKPGVNEESYDIPYSGPYMIYPNFSGDKIFIVTNTDVFFIDVEETNIDPFNTHFKSSVVVKAICSDKDDNIYLLCFNDTQDGLTLFTCTYSKSTFLFDCTETNNLISSDLFVSPNTHYYIFALTDGTIITCNETKIYSNDTLINTYYTIVRIFVSDDIIYLSTYINEETEKVYRIKNGTQLPMLPDFVSFTAMCVDITNKPYMAIISYSTTIKNNTINFYSEAAGGLVEYAEGSYIIDMKFDPKYGELYTLNMFRELYVYEEPRSVSDNIFDMSVSSTPLDLPLDLYIDHTTQTTCTLFIDQNILSGILEITYKPNDPELEPIETKITEEFNNTEDDIYKTIFNLQPEINYLVRAKIYSNDKIYVSNELEFRTKPFDPPRIDMKINKNKDILFSLSTDPADDPLPPDASYYIAYFQGTIPNQLNFHRVNGSLYILPDTFSLDKNKKLDVYAFIRYGYEIDDKDLIEDVRASFHKDISITLDNIPQTNSSAYSYRPNTRRGVLTEDQYPHPQYS
jgi:hypothetical protein